MIEKRHAVEIEKTREELSRRIHYDSLTGLPNHLLLERRCWELMKQSQAGKGIGVVVINIDHLRNVNESLSRHGGDFVIHQVMAKLVGCLGAENWLFRGSSDSFSILLSGPASEEEITPYLKKIMARTVLQYKMRELIVTLSVGCSLFVPSEEQLATNAKTLLDNAELAMHAVRSDGGNDYNFYHPDMKQHAVDRFELEGGLLQAKQRGEFLLHYQPLISVGGYHVKGMEALIRWRHSDLGIISPAQFIPLAEQTGMIEDIGEWVLETSCQQAKEWYDGGYTGLTLSVNVSGRQLQNRRLAGAIERSLKHTGLPPECLEVEITESLFMKNVEMTIQQLAELKSLGISLAIDDFGTGYSSLAYLRRFPVDTLKIDRAFIRDLSTNKRDTVLAEAMITMAHSLDLRVVAEGVETPEQLTLLKQMGCDDFQGFLYSRPVPPRDFYSILSNANSE